MSKTSLLTISEAEPKDLRFDIFAVSLHRTHKNQPIKISGTFLDRIYKDTSREIVVKKSTQCGISEYMVARTIYSAYRGKSILYVMPTYDLKNLFVKDRVDKSLQNSPFYRLILSEQSPKSAESASLKQIENGTISFVGSNTTNAFISFPADDVYIDELDSCNLDNIPMAMERQSASKDKYNIKVGNPTTQNYGIDLEYQNSDKKKWFIRCQCGEWIHPDFFKHVMTNVNGTWALLDTEYRNTGKLMPICDKCHKPYDRFSHGEWVKENSRSTVSGYHISKMFSTTVTLDEIVKRFTDGLSSDTIMQRFYNGDLGLAYTAMGSKITDVMLDECVDNNHFMGIVESPCIAGIDVGTDFHIVIAEPRDKIIVRYITHVKSEQEVIEILNKFHVRLFVIDALPETRISRKIIVSMGNRGIMCYFTSSELTISRKDATLNVNRTITLDVVKENIVMKNIILPANAKSIPEFYDHMTASTRVFDEKGNKYDWVHGNAPDHWFLAFGYMLLAKKILTMAR